MNLNDVYDDLSAFADDPGDVVVERDGNVLFVQSGIEVSFLIRQEEGNMFVIQDQSKMPYLNYLRYNIAGLGVFAERLLAKRPTISAFVDGPAKIESVSLSPEEGPALKLLDRECLEVSPFSSRVVFITGDAGHGKTALLKEYQARQARRFLDKHSNFLFWHVDLQGRQLVRLQEALMGDLGELRVSGLWMAGIIRLLRHGMLVLAIDGFDELAAEQGRTDAYGALAAMVHQMDDKGVIIAASRRTFFDTEDYARRTGLLRRRVSSNCEFDQIKLDDWTRSEDVKYFSNVVVDGERFDNPDQIYEEILAELQNNPSHPMLSRPFLVTRLAQWLLRFKTSPREFIRSMQNPLGSSSEIVRAFIEREVSEKWISKETGEPYLSIDQHMQLLSTIAQEMWSNQIDRLPIDVIETITVLLMDQWKIKEERRRQIFEMVTMHVLLVKPSDGDEGSRTFDHPEFRNYFVAYALADVIKRSVKEDSVTELGEYLSFAQLPDGVAKFAALMLGNDEAFTKHLVLNLNKLVSKEWRPTFIQTNVGTIMPCILNGYNGKEIIYVKGNNVYSSLVFDNTYLQNIEFEGGSFLNVSFNKVHWNNIIFNKCDFTEITFDNSAIFKDVRMISCNIHGVKFCEDDDEIRGYSPERISQIMNNRGIQVILDKVQDIACGTLEIGQRELANRLLRIFRRTIVISDNIINLKIKGDQQNIVYQQIIPLMEKYGLIEAKPWRGGGQTKIIWSLKKGLEEIVRADCGEGDSDIVNFWNEIDNL